jgi:hypothetical protein
VGYRHAQEVWRDIREALPKGQKTEALLEKRS